MSAVIKSGIFWLLAGITILGLFVLWVEMWLIWWKLPSTHPWKRKYPNRPMEFSNWCEHSTPDCRALAIALAVSTSMLTATSLIIYLK